MSASTFVSRRVDLVLILLVVLLGAGLRVWYASGELHMSRFEDEKYSLQNVRKLLGAFETGTWDFEPVSGYYPSPVFNLPQTLLLEGSQRLAERLDAPSLRTYEPGGVIQPTGFLLSRLVQTLCGVLTIWLTYRIGRRVAGAFLALLAATLVALMPWMIHASGYNKPDALLVMAVLLSLHAALRALDATRSGSVLERSSSERSTSAPRTIGRWIWAGVAIALAMSAKLTGGFAALPLTVGAIVAPGTARQRLERFGLLVVAGVTSALTFVLLNPYWPAYLHFIRGLQRDYAGRTDAARWEIPWQVATMQIDRFAFGPLVGPLVLAGFAAMIVAAVRYRLLDDVPAGDQRPGERSWLGTHLAMLVAYPLLYTVAYALQTPYFKPNNFLPTVPFFAVAFVVAVGWLSGALRSQGLRRVVLAAVAMLVVAHGFVGWSYAYNSRVPTTLDIARMQLDERLTPAAGHLVWTDEWRGDAEIQWDGARRLHGGLSAMTPIDPSRVSPPALGLAAATVLRRDGDLREAFASAAPDALGAGPAERWTIESSAFRVRGPALEVTLRPATRREPVPILVPRACAADCIEAALPPDLESDEIVSTFFLLPFRLLASDPRPTLRLGEQSEPLQWISQQRGGHLFAGPRMRVPVGAETLRVLGRAPFGEPPIADADLDGLVIELHRWTPRTSPP